MKRVGKALLILNLQLLVVCPNFLQPKIDRGVKTQDQYWQDTGLGSKELESLIADDNCRLDNVSFLACANAISQMAERLGLVFQLDGTFRKIESNEIAERLTEKSVLKAWESKVDELRNSISFFEAWKTLDQEYIQKSERATLISYGLNGFLSIFKDPHSYLIPIAMYNEVVATSDAKAAHSGLIARRQGESVLVRKVYPQSAAAISGVRKGDKIISLNGETVINLMPSKINDLLRMKNISLLSIEVERGGKILDFLIERSDRVLPSVSSELIEGKKKIGLLTIHKFSRGVCTAAKGQLKTLMNERIDGLMLDLRDNPGGQVDEAACIANMFLEKGTFLFETRYLDSTKTSDQYIAEEAKTYAGPLAILVNSGSASASEIVAGTLKDYSRAKLVGERTFGKGSFQDGKVWGANPKIALFETEGFYYFASGWTPQIVGLQPDVEVKFNSSDIYREDESFMKPLVPLDAWSGPQSLSWLMERDCNLDDESLVGTNAFIGDDPQMLKAQALMNCGASNDRNGSL